MKTALILPTTASFHLIAGLTLIQRTVLTASCSGCERIVILAGTEPARLRELLASDPRTQRIEVLDPCTARDVLDEEVAIIPADCLLTPAALKRVMDTRLQGRAVVFRAAAGGSPLVVCRTERLDLDGWSKTDLTAGLEALCSLDEVETVTLEEDVCIPVTDITSARRAEAELFRQLRASTAESDGLLARWVDRSVSQWLSRRLVLTPLRPNHITMIATATGLLAAWCISRGGYPLEVVGTLLFLGATVIDGCDGEVARLKFQATRFGHALDVTTDNVVHAAIFFAIGWGQHRQHPADDFPVLMGLMLTGLTCAAGSAYWCFERAPRPRVNAPTPQTTKGKLRRALLRGFEAVANRDFAYVLFALALAGRLHWFFWGTLFGTYAFAAILLWVYRWRDDDSDGPVGDQPHGRQS